MAQRDQRRGLLGRHDAGQPRRLERIAFLDAPRTAPDDGPRATSRSSRARPLRAGSPACRRRRPSSRARARRRASVDARPCPLPHLPDLPDPPHLPYSPSPSPCARKNDRLSSDTVRSTLFSFTSGGACSVPGEKFRTALMPAATTRLTTCCADGAGTAMTAMLMPSRRTIFFEIVNLVDRHAAARLLADLGAQGVEQRRDLEAFLAEPRIVAPARARGCRRP